MMKPFTPRTDWQEFLNYFLDGREGASHAYYLLYDMIRNEKEASQMDLFMALCTKYNVSYEAFETEEDGKTVYKVITKFNGNESFSMTYEDKDMDVAVQLGTNLSFLLADHIGNEIFVDKVKNSLNQ